MTRHLSLKPHHVLRDDRTDGTVILRSGHALGPVARCTGDWLDHWGALTPDRVFLAERDGDGWRKVCYGAALKQVRAIASHLLDRDLGPDRPILILSGNGIDHGLLCLAAQYVGIPTVPLAEQYSLIPAAHGRLAHAAKLTKPGMIFTADAAQYAQALALDELGGTEVVSSRPGSDRITAFLQLLTPSKTDVCPAAAAVDHDTLAKILLTSGSTSEPKGVLTTQRMMTTNQAQIAACLPLVSARPPVLVDWLPWNHVFGGSYNFNLVLANGGSLYIDDGKPAPGLFERTLENLKLQSATISFNVPIGFSQLVSVLEKDGDLRETYFRDLDMIFYAGASLPQETWSALERLAREAGRPQPLITTSWGLTETAPGALIAHEPAQGAGLVGVPMPGIEVKLVPVDDGRFDVRVRGDNVFKGYLNNPDKTRTAFDDEGFFLTDDAMRFADPEDVNKGMQFDGRLSEDFKLATGIWVRAANLRLELLATLAPFAQEVVITGEGRDSIGALILPNRGAIAAQGWEVSETGGILRCGPLEDVLHARLAQLATSTTGSATRVACAMILSAPASMADGEATAKGNINFPKFLAMRAVLVDKLFDDSADEPIRLAH